MPVFREYPYGAFNFQIEVNGLGTDGASVKGSFSEASGLDAELEPIEYRTGTEDIAVPKLPGLKKFPNIVLKRGVIGDLAFWNWLNAGLKGRVRRLSGSVALLDENRREVMRWNFDRGWPCKYTGPSLNAKNNEVALETLEICVESLSVDGES